MISNKTFITGLIEEKTGRKVKSLKPTFFRYIRTPVTETIKGELLSSVREWKQGLLYSRQCILDIRKISASDEWIIPKEQFGVAQTISELFTAIGGDSVAGKKLKQTGNNLHNDSFWNGCEGITSENGYLFTARANGYRDENGVFYGRGFCYRMHIMGYDPDDSRSSLMELTYDSDAGIYGVYEDTGRMGASVRLCRPTAVPNGTSGTYTQNDGTTIPTIVINHIEWTMDLIETKYRNGDLIPIVSDNSEWAGMNSVTGCACYVVNVPEVSYYTINTYAPDTYNTTYADFYINPDYDANVQYFGDFVIDCSKALLGSKSDIEAIKPNYRIYGLLDDLIDQSYDLKNNDADFAPAIKDSWGVSYTKMADLRAYIKNKLFNVAWFMFQDGTASSETVTSQEKCNIDFIGYRAVFE